MHASGNMALHLDHPIAYDDALIAARVAKREQKTQRTLVAIALAILFLIPVWIAFLRYV